MKWLSGENIYGLLVSMTWLIAILISAIHDTVSAFRGDGHSIEPLGSTLEKAMSAIWSLAPWLSPEFRAACSWLGIITTLIVAKRGMIAAERDRKRTGTWIVRLGFAGIVALIVVLLQSWPWPESWLPGSLAHIRFIGVALLSLAAVVLLSSAAGLEVGSLLSRRSGHS
jgi:hypothetical protein